jgi:small subunit ribosomal protein S17
VAAPPADEPAAHQPPAEAPAAEAPAAEEPAPAPQSGPKPKKTRLPRSQRPVKTRPKREKAAERKPIVRLEKPEHDRGRRQERQGTVVSDAMDKTIVVKVDTIKAHPRYKKVVRRSSKFHAHDERNEAKTGDVVRIVETRPLSRTKRWRLAEVVEAAK